MFLSENGCIGVIVEEAEFLAPGDKHRKSGRQEKAVTVRRD